MTRLLEKNGWCCGLIGLFALLLWGQTVQFDFVWDDDMYIVDNANLHSLSNIPKFFCKMELQSSETPSVSYRPLRNTVYSILYALGGRSAPKAWIFHLANVLWHAGTAVLLLLVTQQLWQRLAGTVSPQARIAALLVALGFAAQPVTSEVVCWAKCLDDMMSAVFVLAAMRSLLKWTDCWRGYVASLIWFVLAVFSKDSAVAFASVVFFILLGFHKLPWQRCVKLTIPFFGVALFYVAVQRLVMGHLSQCAPLSGSYGQTLIDMFPVVQEYLRLLWGIPPFCADYNYMVAEPPDPFLSGPVLAGLSLLLFFGWLSLWLWRRPEWRISAFGLIWIALFLLPVSNLVPMMQYMAERFLYLPLMGFLLALAGVLPNLARWRLAVFAASALILIWASSSLGRMQIWHDDLTLYFGTELEHPGIKRIQKNAVAAIFRLPQMKVLQTDSQMTRQQLGNIVTTLQRARQIYPENDELTTQLGLAEARLGRLKDGVRLLDLAVHQNPASAAHQYVLASLYRLDGQAAKAKEACAEALRLDPKNKDAQRLKAKLEDQRHPANPPKTP